ncbi:MAG TPA: sulfite exporter TauE/SafE family protein [Candidatus Omnitrophota bacterium]|nr:sulfite exporter TauE/SafE family protein [Candidatus Omnitrophota bacterium]
MTFVLMILTGAAAGFLSGALGVGGGTVLIPAFMRFFGMETHRAFGTSLAVIVLTAFFGAIRYKMDHMVDLKVFAVVSVFSVIGVLIGAHISLGLEAGLLRKIFAVFLAVVAVHMFFKA